MRPKFVMSILDLTKEVLRRAARQGSIAVDGTAGNGHDTLFLAEQAGPEGHVYAFDVQENAAENTRARVALAGFSDRVTVLLAGHETVAEHVAEAHRGNIAVAMYNLGYLPGGDRETVTAAGTTITSLESLLPIMSPNGVVSIHIYTGHPGGETEGAAVMDWAAALDWKTHRVARYDFSNKTLNRETLLIIEKLY